MATLTEEDIAEIRARAKREDDHDLWRYTTIERHLRAHSDRAKLLAHITEQSAQIARMDAEIAGEREARWKAEAACRSKDSAVGTLINRLQSKHGDSCEDLIP